MAVERILADGDSCGHRMLLCDLAEEYKAELVWVCNFAQSAPPERDGLKLTVRQTDVESQAVDMVLMNLSQRGDVVITGDIGLAAVCSSRGAAVLGPRGHWFYEERMAESLELRHLAARQRKAGKRSHGPPGASRIDDQRFEEELRAALSGGEKEA